MTSVTSAAGNSKHASGNPLDSAPPAASSAAPGRRPRAQEPSGSLTQPPPSLDQQHLAAVDRKALAQSDTQQSTRESGAPQVYGEVDPTRRGQVFSLRG